MKLVTAEIMRKLDRQAIEGLGIPGALLMENAGRAVAEEVWRRWRPRRVAVVAGKGNNGGDGFVVARHLSNRGVEVAVFLLARGQELRGDAQLNWRIWCQMGGHVQEVLSEEALEALSLRQFDVLVDAIFGTGLSSEVRGLQRRAIELINAAERPVAAVDIPSGVEASSGRVLGVAVRADLTVTFALAKVGQAVWPGLAQVGELVVADISIPRRLLEEADTPYELLEPGELPSVPPRSPWAHKGNFGHLLVVAGSPGKTGAAALCAQAAARSGAGLVTLIVPQSLNPILEVKLTEAMTEPVPDEDGFLGPSSLEAALQAAQGKTALVLGPGISTRQSTVRFVGEFLERVRLPLVIDADGLNCLTRLPRGLELVKGAVLTPHPGEMARLVGCTPGEVQAQRLEVARQWAQRWEVVLVLKGARTVIANPQGRAFINPTGNPGMASGGMGDVLTGMIGSFVAQGMGPLEAAKLGVFLHGAIADRLARGRGQLGMLAGELIEGIPQALADLGGNAGAPLGQS